MSELPRSFGRHGSEKMVYDVRMGPQCLHDRGCFYAAYQANAAGGRALPHIICRDADGRWSDPVVLGDVARWDHHYAPILWTDAQRHIHVLFHCHFQLNEARHMVSSSPMDITSWSDGPPLAPSISYPRMLRASASRMLFYYRSLGHMGWWTYNVSSDGGAIWPQPKPPLVDFDHRPEIPGDEWAGSYHNVALSLDGKSLHIAFVRWDERNFVNLLYGKPVGLQARYDLYYARLEIDSGSLFNIEGKLLERPLNRRHADDQCLVWQTGDQLTNMPSILIDPGDRPQFLVPVAESELERCSFWFIRREGDAWRRTRVTGTTSIWNGSHLEYAANGAITAFLIGSTSSPGDRPYGGGPLQEWKSIDGGESWQQVGEFQLPPGVLCNNPKGVEDVSGTSLKRTLIFFTWNGPDGILPEGPFRGQAHLWQDGRWL